MKSNISAALQFEWSELTWVIVTVILALMTSKNVVGQEVTDFFFE